MLLVASVIVKIIGAVYKIPLTAYIGAVGRGYFATAYNLYLPLHAVIMGAMPVAMSRLVSKYISKGDNEMLSSLRKGAGSLFFLAGVIAFSIIFICAKPYSLYVASSPKSVYTVWALAPGIIICCIASMYRGFYEGFLDMRPTAVSQTGEALFKLIFGILFAKLTLSYLYNAYLETGEIFGTALKTDSEALGFIYPYSSAAAMLGVTLGSLISLIYVVIYDKINRPSLPKCFARKGRRELFSFSLPIMLSCCVQSVFQFLDTATVQYSLKLIPKETLKSALEKPLSIAQTADGDIVTYAWGLFSSSLDFKNLIPGITMALGICAVPAICREYERRNYEKTGELINLSLKYTSLLSVFAGGFIALFSAEILNIFYGSSSPDVALGCRELVRYFAISAPLYSLASTAVFTVQALGRPEKSIAPYVISGIIRCVMNVALVSDGRFLLNGAVISGAVSYGVMFLLNFRLVKRLSCAKISLFKTVLLPVFAGVLSCFFTIFLKNRIFFSKNGDVKLLIETTLFAAIYCILCFFFKLLKFEEIFCVLNFKKNGLNT